MTLRAFKRLMPLMPMLLWATAAQACIISDQPCTCLDRCSYACIGHSISLFEFVYSHWVGLLLGFGPNDPNWQSEPYFYPFKALELSLFFGSIYWSLNPGMKRKQAFILTGKAFVFFAIVVVLTPMFSMFNPFFSTAALAVMMGLYIRTLKGKIVPAKAWLGTGTLLVLFTVPASLFPELLRYCFTL